MAMSVDESSRTEEYSSELAAQLAADVRDRLVRYARIDTQSKHGVEKVPSTDKQLDLSRLLVEELEAMGASDVEMDDHGIVFATIPATTDKVVPTIGFLAHVDTSPDAPATGVSPQVIRYEGGTLPLSSDGAVALDPADSPELLKHVGHELVTTDGTTLLGADDKAGVAAIMGAAAHLLGSSDVVHGNLRLAFTTDEEVGHGSRYFDIERFGARCAYTIDGSTAGEIEDESFTAARATVTFHGFSWHPGFAKGRMVNSIKLAQRFLSKLPPQESPEETEGRQGYVHPVSIEGSADKTVVSFIVRDFQSEKVDERIEMLRALAEEAVSHHQKASVDVEAEIEYRNMKEVLDKTPEVLASAEEAIRRAGLEPIRGSIRGGTDGSMLTLAGLPTPNIFNGSQDFHSVKEWACVADMAAAAVTIIRLAEVWAE
jgi:tripeptide aminopeptidase